VQNEAKQAGVTHSELAVVAAETEVCIHRFAPKLPLMASSAVRL
jgi:hypothetical protein